MGGVLFELFLPYADLLYLLEERKVFVDLVHELPEEFFYLLFILCAFLADDACYYFHIGSDGRYDGIVLAGFVGLCPYHGLCHSINSSQVVLKLFGEYVLAVSGDDYVLLTSCDVDEVLIVCISQVSCEEPSVLDDLCGLFRHLIVTHHYVGSLDADLAYAVLALVDDLHLHTGHDVSDRGVSHPLVLVGV